MSRGRGKIYPVPDVAEKLGISRQWVYQLLDRGKIEEATPDDLIDAGMNPELIPTNRRFITEDALNGYIQYHDNYIETMNKKRAEYSL